MAKPMFKQQFERVPTPEEFNTNIHSRPAQHQGKVVQDTIMKMLKQLQQLRMFVDIETEPAPETQDDTRLFGLEISESRFTGAVYADSISVKPGTAPATAASTGRAGQIVITADYIYVCTGADTWKRAAITTF